MLKKDFARLISKVVIAPDGCLLWTASLSHDGYGRFSFRDTIVYAHRAAYEHWVGPIPEGLTLDHLCRVRHCVAPAHLEPVSQRENQARGDGPQASSLYQRPDQAKCGNGLHDWTEDNISVHPSGNKCRICHLIRNKRR